MHARAEIDDVGVVLAWTVGFDWVAEDDERRFPVVFAVGAQNARLERFIRLEDNRIIALDFEVALRKKFGRGLEIVEEHDFDFDIARKIEIPEIILAPLEIGRKSLIDVDGFAVCENFVARLHFLGYRSGIRYDFRRKRRRDERNRHCKNK